MRAGQLIVLEASGDRLASGATPSLGGLLEEFLALDLLGETFLFAKLLEAAHHLLNALAAA